jgi:hypothetical protein
MMIKRTASNFDCGSLEHSFLLKIALWNSTLLNVNFVYVYLFLNLDKFHGWPYWTLTTCVQSDPDYMFL